MGCVWDCGRPRKEWLHVGRSRPPVPGSCGLTSKPHLHRCMALHQPCAGTHHTYKASPFSLPLVPPPSHPLAFDDTRDTNTLQCLSIGATGAMVSFYRFVPATAVLCLLDLSASPQPYSPDASLDHQRRGLLPVLGLQHIHRCRPPRYLLHSQGDLRDPSPLGVPHLVRPALFPLFSC